MPRSAREKSPEYREQVERKRIAEALARAVIRLRITHDLTQVELAKELGVSMRTIRRLESGDGPRRLDRWRRC